LERFVGDLVVFAFSQTWEYYNIISDEKQLENLFTGGPAQH